ncbi:phosphotransferase family protein [Actinopolymorpha rutila]|uniref:Aminoglycoside phosphotransferase (APT) family kinase protein n=1 Tax=Actinopolymorpha rutila TaxID=446787 RepID=A0A852ZNV3_9ACTN|nr:phosphotransferase [Actinopolymorpha rutila]NYH90760.1 aminoglycoside phosphotransferase (APT) family kinase protein [Actinopolymorpha rutila]
MASHGAGHALDWVRTRWGPDAVARVVRRTPITNGYSSQSVERLDLIVQAGDGSTVELAVLRKHATEAEVTVLRALREVTDPRASALPELLADGTDATGPWVVLPFYSGSTLASEAEVSDDVLESLAVLHVRHVNATLPGLPIVDGTWWDNGFRHVDRRLSELLPTAAEPAPLREALDLVRSLRGDPLLVRTPERLSRTLVHGDIHANNILARPAGSKIIDWGAATLAPAMLDLANLVAPDSPRFAVYVEAWEAAAGRALDLRLANVEYQWATACVNIKYLGFAAHHLGGGTVRDMLGRARRALNALAHSDV